MTTLTPEKRVDRNGHLVTRHVKSDTSSATSASTRTLPPHKLSTGYLAEDEQEYIWSLVNYSATPDDDTISEVAQWASNVIEVLPTDWIPESVTDVEDADSLAEFAQSDYAHSQCLFMSEAVVSWLQHDGDGTRDAGKPHRAFVVQGLPTPGMDVFCHYAIAVQMGEDSEPVIVDYTYAQFDPDAEFPVVMSPQAWQERLMKNAHI